MKMKQFLYTIIRIIVRVLSFFNKLKKYFDFIISIFISEWKKRELLTADKLSFIERNVQIYGGKYISLGKNSSIKRNSSVSAWYEFKGSHYSPRITIGNECSIGEYCHITCINEIIIGNGVLIGKNVLISDNSHGDINDKTNFLIQPNLRKLTSKGPVIIGNNVWIGEKVSILENVKIGKNSIIGAHSVVNRDIPENTLAVGIPVKIIKNLL